MKSAVALVLVVGALGVGAAGAQPVHNPQAERYFRVEWEAGQSRSGRPVIRGYVHNSYGHVAGNVRLLVEGLDAAGRVVGRTEGYVNGDVPVFGRAYFEARAPEGAASYRVTVVSFDWRPRGS